MKFGAALLAVASHAVFASAFAPSFKPAFTSASSSAAVARPETKLFGEYGASSTSFYTTTEKKDSYKSLDDILTVHCKDEKVRQVIKDMLEACAEITEALRTALVTVEGSMNSFGDAQLSVDVSKVLY